MNFFSKPSMSSAEILQSLRAIVFEVLNRLDEKRMKPAPIQPTGIPASCPVCQSPALEPALTETGAPRFGCMVYPTGEDNVEIPISRIYGCTTCRITVVVPFRGAPYRLGEQLEKRKDAHEQKLEDAMKSLRGDPDLRKQLANAHRPPDPSRG